MALAALEAEHGKLPETATVISGRGDGGYHLWFDGVTGPVRTKLCKGVVRRQGARRDRNTSATVTARMIVPMDSTTMNDVDWSYWEMIMGLGS